MAAYFKKFNDVFYTYKTVNHSKIFLNSEDPNINTQLIENLWGRLKKFLRTNNYKRRSVLDLYISEFCFRKKFRNKNRKDFLALFLKA